jgi:Predicted RNA-binding protein homologous to eukaryotic snRNP
MPLDAVFVTELCRELSDTITGMKIDRVRQPEKDTVVLVLRGAGGGAKLLVCVAGGSARVCLTQQEYENPFQPPMFCMLLRKHLTGARIVSVTQPEGERMLLLSVTGFDEMGQPKNKTIAVEMLGRNANFILVDGEGRIVDALRRVDAEMSPARQLLPGLIYRLPPRPEPGRFSGLSPLIAREMEFRDLPKSPDSLAGLAKKPVLLVENKQPKDFTFLPIYQYGPGCESVEYPGWSELLEAFYAQKDHEAHIRSRGHSLLKLVRGAVARTDKKLGLRQQELSACDDMDDFRRRADLITANIWRLKKGMAELSCEDFYEPDSPAVKIPLDPLKTPQQNAEAFYKAYTKKKAAREHLTALIGENAQELDYLQSVAEELERAQSQQDLDEIGAELTAGGYIRARANAPKKKQKPSEPLRYRTESGLEILVGRNNVQNDELTLRIARRTDRWFHAQKLHGAHVILRCEDAQPDEAAVRQAACLAAYYSEGAQAGRVPVDTTEVRFVKKPHGARPGMVIYTDYKTVLAEPRI